MGSEGNGSHVGQVRKAGPVIPRKKKFDNGLVMAIGTGSRWYCAAEVDEGYPVARRDYLWLTKWGRSPGKALA